MDAKVFDPRAVGATVGEAYPCPTELRAIDIGCLMPLSLETGGGNALDQQALEDEKNDKDRHQRNERHGHQRPPGRLACRGHEEAESLRHGVEVHVGEVDEGEQKVLVGPDEGEDGGSDQGAELVVWPSAYDGGFALQAYAWLRQYYVASSVRTEHSRIIDITRRILASTSRWHRVATETIDLEKERFHIDD
jgi:hypothetical protein